MQMPATQVAGIFIMGFVRGDSRDQGTLFPVSLDELLPEDHVCRVIDGFVASLDLTELGLIRGEWLAIDGSKVEAVASRKAVLSRERLLKRNPCRI
jgi:transposase